MKDVGSLEACLERRSAAGETTRVCPLVRRCTTNWQSFHGLSLQQVQS